MASAMRPTLLRQTATAFARPSASSCLRASPLANHAAAVRVAAFHTSSQKNLLPPGPQVIKGSVNDAAPVPDASPTHGSYHWTFERTVAAGLVPLSIAPFAGGSLNPAMDAVLCSLLLVHSHVGMQSIIIDYIPKRRYPGAFRAAMWLLNGATVLVGIGLYEFETNDVGITETIKRVWTATNKA
ncbi:mitochondrial succinate dehydrogenase cytochrome b560 subunit D [Xylariaceae sp. FL0255]|nr:mitochondrial succinate dehydrogenase cytochrome b560 subunit D [Xylariaceae sp. FL0255]